MAMILSCYLAMLMRMGSTHACLLQDGVPETSGDFERLIVAEPNNSFLWVKYMAFKLSLADVEV